MLRRCASATLALMLAGLACAADTTDSLTGLPVPDAASGIKLYDPPMKLDPAQICKSTQVTDFYSTADFKTSAAIAWYSTHLKDFKHMHGYGAGRTQDAFVNADGTLMVVITGSPGADGVDSNAYAVTYATLKPGMPQKTMTGLLSQKISC
jgi:hypothetical protein